MKPLPRRIDFGLAVIHLRQVGVKEIREEADCEADDPTPDGLWDAAAETIFVLRRLSLKRKREVLFHELVHAAVDQPILVEALVKPCKRGHSMRLGRNRQRRCVECCREADRRRTGPSPAGEIDPRSAPGCAPGRGSLLRRGHAQTYASFVVALRRSDRFTWTTITRRGPFAAGSVLAATDRLDTWATT
jgi:hypothetical protein